ncbi:transglutaminase-like domain-containing protein [Christensenellaceae bacterium OttesenSCG-928-M15]|nr:transglutaminase-like domain-containing protein [Christensenellaceae bacterium OttesenSCG-928-M15]
MKKLFVLLLAAVMLLPTPALAFREEGEGGWNVTEEESGGAITFIPDEGDGGNGSTGGNASIPSVESPATTGKPFKGDKVVKGALVNVTDVKGDYKKGSVYGPKLSTKELQQVKAAVIKAVNACIREGMSDGQKIVALVNYLCDKVSYADDWSKNKANTAYGALIYGKAQCSGYSRALMALLHAVDVDAKWVHASSKAINPSHQWVLVKYAGSWYHLDPQGIDDYMEINTATMQISYPRPIVLMANYMPYETKGLPKTGSRDIALQ